MTGVLANLFKSGAKEVIKTTGEVLDNLITNKEEREAAKLAIQAEINRHQEAQQTAAADIEKAYLADVANSRDTNARIQESDKASWMAKNVGYIIDITLIASFLLMLVIIVYRAVPEQNKELFYMAFGSLGTFAGTSINWHRGSSQSSANKQSFIDRMLKK